MRKVGPLGDQIGATVSLVSVRGVVIDIDPVMVDLRGELPLPGQSIHGVPANGIPLLCAIETAFVTRIYHLELAAKAPGCLLVENSTTRKLALPLL